MLSAFKTKSGLWKQNLPNIQRKIAFRRIRRILYDLVVLSG
jgi:hypothetical protein